MQGRQDATGFHRFVWHKKSKGRDNIPARRHWDTVAKKCTAPLQVPSTRDGTKQGLATFIPSLKNSQFLLARYKELLLFIMSVGYAELYKCKVSIISVFKASLANIIRKIVILAFMPN